MRGFIDTVDVVRVTFHRIISILNITEWETTNTCALMLCRILNGVLLKGHEANLQAMG